MLELHWLILLSVPLIISFCLSFLYIKWAFKRSILDIPNERSSHLVPTPRGGGIAIVITFYLGSAILYLEGQLEKNLFYALLPGLILAVIGTIDDIKNLTPKFRLAIQFICAGTALFLLGGFQFLNSSNFLTIWTLVALLGIIWFINLFNFLDGSDGYASMEAISVVLALWFFTGSEVLLLLAFSVIGFLYWNWPKAKIFMGDSGSTTLGFILVVFGIHFHNNNELNFIFWILLTSLFWFDATFTLFRRILNKEKLSKAHKNHMYQRMIKAGFSHQKVLFKGLGINILLFIISLSIWRNYISYLLGILFTLLILGLCMKYVDRKFAFYHKKKSNVNTKS